MSSDPVKEDRTFDVCTRLYPLLSKEPRYDEDGRKVKALPSPSKLDLARIDRAWARGRGTTSLSEFFTSLHACMDLLPVYVWPVC